MHVTIPDAVTTGRADLRRFQPPVKEQARKEPEDAFESVVDDAPDSGDDCRPYARIRETVAHVNVRPEKTDGARLSAGTSVSLKPGTEPKTERTGTHVLEGGAMSLSCKKRLVQASTGAAAILAAAAFAFSPISPLAQAMADDVPGVLDTSGQLVMSGGDTGTSVSEHPMTASVGHEVEQHVLASTWQDEYDVATAMTEAQAQKAALLVSPGNDDARFVAPETATMIEHMSEHAAQAATIGEAKTSYSALVELEVQARAQISAGIEEEARQAAIAEKRARITGPGLDASGWSDEKVEFVERWGAANDAFMRGRTAYGYGQNFAAAAYDNDVDPRIGAAIAMIESGCGDADFGHNMWGWGSSRWSSYEESIAGWTAAFHRGYGYDMDYADCRAYCPPNPGYYSKLTGLMSEIG